MAGDNHLGSMETEGHVGSIPIISVLKIFIDLFFLFYKFENPFVTKE